MILLCQNMHLLYLRNLFCQAQPLLGLSEIQLKFLFFKIFEFFKIFNCFKNFEFIKNFGFSKKFKFFKNLKIVVSFWSKAKERNWIFFPQLIVQRFGELVIQFPKIFRYLRTYLSCFRNITFQINSELFNYE